MSITQRKFQLFTQLPKPTFCKPVALFLLGVLWACCVSAAEFLAALPKSNVPESVLFTLNTSADEFVFFESPTPQGLQMRFSRVDARTGSLLDQPLLELPEFSGVYSFSSINSARVIALSDGGFVIAQSYATPFMGPAYTRFTRVGLNGQVISTRTEALIYLSGIIQSGTDEITVFDNRYPSRLGVRIALPPTFPITVPLTYLSPAQVCPVPVNQCRWQIASLGQVRASDLPAEMHLLRMRRSSFELEQMELLRVDVNGNVLSSQTLGNLPSNSQASLQQFDQGLLLSITSATLRTLSYYSLGGQLLWHFSQPSALNLGQHSADAHGLTAITFGQDGQRIKRYDASGELLWNSEANHLRAVRFHANGNVAVHTGVAVLPGSWQWIRRDGRLLSLPESVRSFAFTSDGGAVAVAPELGNAKGSRLLGFNAQSLPTSAQWMPKANLSPAQLRLLPNEHGVDIAYVESNRMQLWRYNPSGVPASRFHIADFPADRVVVDSVDRSFVLTFENSLLALGPLGVRLWERELFGAAGSYVVPLNNGVLVSSSGEARVNLRTLDSAGEIVANLDLAANEGGSELSCRKLEQFPGQANLASCFHRPAPGAPISVYVVDASLHLHRTALIFSAAQFFQLTDDGGAILSDLDAGGSIRRQLRVDRYGQQLWQVQGSGVVPTRSGGAWLRSDDFSLRYIDGAGAMHASTLAPIGSAVALADDSVLFVTESEIARVQFSGGQFLTSHLMIEPTRTLVGEVRVNGLRSTWLEKTNGQREYSLRMYDWPQLSSGETER